MVSRLAEMTRVQYNLDRHCFGYGDDAKDWSNAGEKWIEPEAIDKDEEGCLLLYIDRKELEEIEGKEE